MTGIHINGLEKFIWSWCLVVFSSFILSLKLNWMEIFGKEENIDDSQHHDHHIISKKTQLKTFDFLIDSDQQIVSVTIQEVLDHDYGLYVWPSAPVLAQYILYQREKVKDRRIVELGAGTALAGLVAAKCGAKSVTLTDHAEKTETLENCRSTVRLNELPTHTVVVCNLTWGHLGGAIMSLRGCDIILAADCFYSTKDFEPVLVTVAYLFEANPMAEFWCTYQVRSSDRSFEYLFEKWDMQCRHVHLDEFTDNIHIACGDNSHFRVTHEIQMLVITPAAVT